MIRRSHRASGHPAFATAATTLGLLLLTASPALASNYSGPVAKSEWTGGMNVPSYIDMFIAVPDNMPEKPPILVNIHSCGNSAGGQWSYAGFASIREAIDSVGFIMIVPQQSRNCWNVGAPESLTHDGGGDTGAIVQMVKHVIEKYNADPTRVYAMGGSGGGMAVQALLAVYPEVFKGGHARAGVAAGCWAEGYDDGMQWSGSCAGGSVDKTPEQWGDYVRAINPSYAGPRPRIQINQGNVDETINFNNFREGLDEWTNVLGLEREPTSTDSGFQGEAATYDRQFWVDECGYTVIEAWEALNMGHSMGYESLGILDFFGLDQVREQDPWDEMCGDFGGGGGGAGGTGAGAGGAGVGGGSVAAGGMMAMGGMTAAGGAVGMGAGSGGQAGSDGTMPMGGSGAPMMVAMGAGASATGAAATGAPTGGTVTATGTAPGMTATGAGVAPGAAGMGGGSSGLVIVAAGTDSAGGCSVSAPADDSRSRLPWLGLLGLSLLGLRRRR